MKNWMYFLLGLAAVFIGYRLFAMRKRADAVAEQSVERDKFGMPRVSASTCTEARYGNGFPCDLVVKLQRWVNTHPPMQITVDGLWGPETASALESLGHIEIARGTLSKEQLNALIS